ncbi:MAG: nitroreductase [Mycobacterium sp.]|nr:nitroreductase [Mycobacterium sp.]
MDLYDVMRTTFAAREFTGEPLPDRTLYRILDNARFAPSGGNRQAVRIIVLRDQKTRDRLAELSVRGAQRYVAQLGIGEAPWNPLRPSSVPAADVVTTEVPDTLIAPLRRASVVLVVCLDLRYVAATDQDLRRVGVTVAPRCTRWCGTFCWPYVARDTAATSARWWCRKSRRCKNCWEFPISVRSPRCWLLASRRDKSPSCTAMNRPGNPGGSRPWKRGWSYAEGTGAWKADVASV